MAQDRLWQMDRFRRRALGRQAEILGAGYIAADIAHLTVGIDVIAAHDAAAMDPATHRLVTAFVAGINRHIETFCDDLPMISAARLCAAAVQRGGYRCDRARHLVVTERPNRSSGSGGGGASAANRAVAPAVFDTGSVRELVAPWAGGAAGNGFAAGTDDTTGSNNWAIDGHAAAPGSPILCGDPHQPFWVPSSWYSSPCMGRKITPPAPATRAAGHVVGQQRHDGLEHHQQRRIHARSVSRTRGTGRSRALPRWRHLARIR